MPRLKITPDGGRRGNAVARKRARIRRGLRTGELRLADVLADPPPELEDVLLVDLVRWSRGVGRSKLERIGRRAVQDGVNLAMTVGRVAPSSRVWAGEVVSVAE
jgi:hypothetical protein